MSGIKGIGQANKIDGFELKIGIVHARWNSEIIEPLIKGAIEEMKKSGVLEENIKLHSVPGSYELPYEVQRVYNSEINNKEIPYDAIIAIGVLIKGSTMHFEYISESVSHGLMNLSLNLHLPVIYGVLNCMNEQQAMKRAGLTSDGHNHGNDWGAAAVEMGYKKKFKSGPPIL